MPSASATASSGDPGAPSTASDGSYSCAAFATASACSGCVMHAWYERAVRLHVGDPGAGHLGEPVERTELVEHGVAQLVGVDVDEAPTEPDQVGVRHLGTDLHVPVGGRLAHAPHRRRVAGVEPAGDVGARDDVEHRLVVTERPHPERLPEIALRSIAAMPRA